MKYKQVTAALLLTAAFSGEAWAQGGYQITGDENWTVDKSFDGNVGSWPYYGIGADTGGGIYTITTNGDITANDNGVGVYIRNGAEVHFDNIGTDKTFTIQGNTSSAGGDSGHGLRVDNPGSVLTIDNMNIDIESNDAIGIWVKDSAVLEISSDSGHWLKAGDNGRHGIEADSSAGISISGMDVQINNNTEIGLWVKNGADVKISGTPGSGHSLQINENGRHGIENYSGALTISDMNVELNQNSQNGLQIAGGGQTLIEGGGQATLSADRNDNNGLYLNDSGSSLTISDMVSVTASGNRDSGIKAEYGTITIRGDGSGSVEANGNNSGSGYAGGIFVQNQATLDISGMHVEVDGNGSYGLMIMQGSTVKITGNGGNDLKVTGNAVGSNNGGIELRDAGSALIISDMNVNLDGNGRYGLTAAEGGVATISSQNGNNSLSASGNKNDPVNWSDGVGLWANGAAGGVDASTINITDMNIEANDNGRYGLSATDGGLIRITGDGGHTLDVHGNVTSAATPWAVAAGIYSSGQNSSLISTIKIEGMDVNVSGNDYYGLFSNDGGIIEISGGAGGNELNVRANNALNGDDGYGIRAAGVNGSGSRSRVNILNMNVSVRDQAYQGIHADLGGLITVKSDSGNNTLLVDNSRTSTASQPGKGIHAQSTGGDGSGGFLSSTIDIEGMDVIATNNELEGLVAADGGVINVKSGGNKTNTLTATGNHKGDYSYGVGLLAHGEENGLRAAINVANMDVIANDNSLNGLYVRDGGMIGISGDGGQKLEASGNRSASNSGSGLAAENSSHSTSSQVAAITVTNMTVEVNDNGEFGIEAANGGQVLISSTQGNTLTVSDNRSDGADKGTGLRSGGISENQIRAQIKIDDMDIVVENSLAGGIRADDGGLINIAGISGQNTLKANGSTGHSDSYIGSGIWAQGINSTISEAAAINITGYNIEASGNQAYGLQAETGGRITIRGDGHTMNLRDNGYYGIVVKTGSAIDIKGMDISGNTLDYAFAGIENGGDLKLADSSISSDNGSLFYTWNDTFWYPGAVATFTLDNVSAVSKGDHLAFFNSQDGRLLATDSYLEGAINTNTNGETSTVSLDTSYWVMKNSSSITSLASLDSIIDMRKSGGYNSLNLNGLSSNDSTYLINTYFDYPGLSTDKIIVGGAPATGAGNIIQVTPTGTDGSGVISGYGIQVVNLDYATDKSVAFSLYGDRLEVGAFDYWLYRAPDDNYYLQTDRKGTALAQALTNTPSIQLTLVSTAATGINEMRKRLFELRHHDPNHDNELWVRSYANSFTLRQSAKSKMDTVGLEIGYDKEIYDNGDDVVYAGVMAGIVRSDDIRHSSPGYRGGKTTAESPSLGLYGVWFNKDGLFAYANLRHFWLDMEAHSYTYFGDLISYNPSRNFLTASFELGKQFGCQIDETGRIVIEPSIELHYAYAGDKHFKTNRGDRVSFEETASFKTRAALLLGYNYKSDSGTDLEPYVELGVFREWAGNTDVTYAGSNFISSMQGTGYDVSLGLSARLDNRWSFFGDVTYQTSANSNYEGAGLQLGLKYSW